MRIAYFSPLNPQPTGISDYSEELLPYLARHATLDLFVDSYQPTNPAIVDRFDVLDYRHFPAAQRRRRYDVCLYHMGNSPFHGYVYDALVRVPGITVLHDYVLFKFFKAASLECRQPAAYLREMGYCYGRQGLDSAHRAMIHGQPFSDYDYPLVNRVVDASLGLIVHSEFLRKLIAQFRPAKPVGKVNHHLSLKALKEGSFEPGPLRASLGLGGDQFVVASFGRLAPNKRLDVLLRACARLRHDVPHAACLLVGETVPPYDVGACIEELGLEGRVVLTGHLGLDEFQRALTAADVCVALRRPTAGETSGSLIRMMGAGKPVIVSDAGAFSELPDDCCIKIGVGEAEEDVLLAHLLELARDPVLRERIGSRARHHVETHHRLDDSARGYLAFIERCLGIMGGRGSWPTVPTHYPGSVLSGVREHADRV